MIYSKQCLKCGKDFTFNENQIEALSQTEQLLCAKENLDFVNMVKVTCSYCGTSSLVPPKTLNAVKDSGDLTASQDFTALASRLESLKARAFEVPGPLFNEQRKQIIEAWLANFATNLEAAARSLTGGLDMNGRPISRQQIAEAVDHMCKEYSQGLQRLEEVCGPRIRQDFEALMTEARSLISNGQPAGLLAKVPPPTSTPSDSVSTEVPPLWEREPATQGATSRELKQRLEEAARRFDRPPRAWLYWIAVALGLLIGFAISNMGYSLWWSVPSALIVFVALGILIDVLRTGPWGTKKYLEHTCREMGLNQGDLLEHLPLRLQNAPGVLEFLDQQAFQKGMERRRGQIETRVNASLAQPKAIDEAIINEALAQREDKPLRKSLAPTEIVSDAARIQAVSAIAQAIAKERQQVIAERNRRTGDLLLNSVGTGVDINTSLQQALDQANQQMSGEFAKFYIVYGILSGILLPLLKGWRWHDAIDTIMGWPDNLHPSVGLAVFLQGYWQEPPDSAISPEVMASRTMCWIYVYPNRWETLDQLLEDAQFHRSALRDGKVKLKALKKQWRDFAVEIKRQTNPLLKREEHKEAASKAMKLCTKLIV